MVDARRLELVGGAYSPEDVLATVGLSGAVDYTIVGGRIVVKDGQLTGMDQEKLSHDAAEKCARYLDQK